jgi:peroxiredoxin
MKKLFLCALCAAMAITGTVSAQTTEITEENYQKLDSIVWAQHQRDQEAIYKEFQEHPERKDSLRKAYNEVYEAASKKNVELAIEFASTPSGFKRLFMVRLDISKGRLRSVLDALPEEMRQSQYGRNIQMHLDTEQIEEGSMYYDFEAVADSGDPFRLSQLVGSGKRVLLLYGGLDCMGPEGRDYLNALYERTFHDDFEIVVYCLNSDLDALKRVRDVFPCKFTLVSDFLEDSTPVKIIYGAQATPTCFFIDGDGIVKMKSEGLNPDKTDKLVAKEA